MIEPYKFKKRRSAKVISKPVSSWKTFEFEKPNAAAQVPDYWQGVKIGSVNEWYVIMALNKLKLEFEYQVPVNGGNRIRGGQIVDFMVKFGGRYQPIQVFGEYYHNESMKTEDELKLAQLQQYYGNRIHTPRIIYGSQSDTYEHALKAVKGVLRL